mmetsp:Transcript_17579/g.31816  ORF Transcript_17579/g.31816 Transcript_17579/m.31816 type:complete len:123 (-) Transcript_17579:220-588(-)
MACVSSQNEQFYQQPNNRNYKYNRTINWNQSKSIKITKSACPVVETEEIEGRMSDETPCGGMDGILMIFIDAPPPPANNGWADYPVFHMLSFCTFVVRYATTIGFRWKRHHSFGCVGFWWHR